MTVGGLSSVMATMRSADDGNSRRVIAAWAEAAEA